jgi:uncharacterized membrane protein YqgA involved in biofilm formation
MLAVILNSVLIIVGTLIGLVFRKLIKPELTNSILKVLGIVVFITGLMGIIKAMIVVENGILKSNFDLFLLVVIVFGMFVGEILKIDTHLNNFGKYLDTKFNSGKISEGFITGTIIYISGAMGIVGSINAALGDSTILYLKSGLDGITSIILATTLGIGVGLSFIPVLLFQGTIYLIAYFLGDFMSSEFINAFSLIGYFIVACIGINFLVKERIKVANLLPSLLLVILYYLIFK